MAVSASPTARAVRTACFAEQMEQKKQLLLASSKKNYPPAFHSLEVQLADDMINGANFLAVLETKAGGASEALALLAELEKTA